MEEFIRGFTIEQWGIIALSALFIGMSKTGISGAGLVAIPLMAAVFGGRFSSGMVLPMLCIADVIAVIYYHRHANWRHIWKLIPAAIVGILTGVYVGNNISDNLFKDIMGVIIITSACYLIWNDIKKNERIPGGLLFPIIIGFLGGFSTMLGNAAGAILALYLLSMRLPKDELIGTGAWFFLIVNFFKVPFHIIFWGTITTSTILLNVTMIPVIILGAISGIYVVKVFPEKIYRIFLIISSILSAAIIIFK